MCGIAGLLHLDGRPAEARVAFEMGRAIAHRGPDADGVWAEGPIALAHRRLAIRDLTASGAQPFHSADGRVVVVYNGEIYNDQALRRELERDHGLISRSTSDTEIIPAGYLAWGEAFVERLSGIFAIALWDRRDRRLILARDGVGVKPLYVQKDASTLRFGSETKALFADPAWRTRLDPGRLHQILALGHLGPAESLYEGVEQIAPGSVRVIDAVGDRTRQFWRPTRKVTITDPNEACAALLDLLPRVVEEQLVSDVPVGVMQSGGVDSTLLTLSLPRSADAPLFTVQFPQASHDEVDLAREVATKARRHLQTVDLPLDGDAETTFRRLVHHLDGELMDSSAYATFRLSEVMRAQVAVAIGGDGGDEFFAGYPTYLATQLARRMAPLTRLLPTARLGRLVRRLAGVSDERVPTSEKLARFLLGCAAPVPHTSWRRYLYDHDAASLYGPALAPLRAAGIDPLEGYGRAWTEAEGGDIDRSLLADQRYYLPADMLMKVDRTSMAHGLEVRVPLLDQRICDLAGSIAADVLYPRGGQPKAILRRAAHTLGAPLGVHTERKRGFNLPINVLLRTSLKPLAERLFGPDAGIFEPYLRADAVREQWLQHQAGRVNQSYVLWTLLTLGTSRELLGTRLADA